MPFPMIQPISLFSENINVYFRVGTIHGNIISWLGLPGLLIHGPLLVPGRREPGEDRGSADDPRRWSRPGKIDVVGTADGGPGRM